MVPLLVVQVPNTPRDELLVSAFKTIKETWPELRPDAMAHVFGDHTTIELAGFTVPHIAPETVQDRTHIRVLFRKGRDIDRLGLPSCRGAGVVPSRQG